MVILVLHLPVALKRPVSGTSRPFGFKLGDIGNRPRGIQLAWSFWCRTKVWHWNGLFYPNTPKFIFNL